jgi:hypothetical protein
VSGLMYGAMPPLNIFVAWYIIKQTGNFTLWLLTQIIVI